MSSQLADNVRTFADLRLAEDTALGRIPLQKITRLSVNSLRRQEADLEVYEFLFNRAIRAFDPDEFESAVSDVVLPELVKHLYKLESELKDQALSCFMDDNLRSLLGLANIMLTFLEHVVRHAEMYQLYRTVVVFMDFLVRAFAIIAQKKPTVNGPELGSIEQLAATCRKLQTLMISMVATFNGTGYYFQHLDVQEELDCLKNVIICFGKIGCTTIPVDLIDAKHAWQAILILATKHAKTISQNDSTWLHELILRMNEEIEKLFNSLVENALAHQLDIRTLKFLNLLLQIMLRLLRSMKLDQLDCFGQLLNTLVSISKALLTQPLEREAAEAIRSNLKVGYMSLIGMSYRTGSFAKALTACRYQSPEELTAYYEVLMEVISKLLSDDPNTSNQSIDLYMSKTCNLLSSCTEHHLPASHALFTREDSLYQKLIAHLAGFVHQCARKPTKKRQKLLEESLVAMILQDSFWVGLAGLDIWNTHLRSIECELTWQYFRFWKVVNDQFAVASGVPRVVFVRRLLRNIFVFMPPRMQRRARDEFPVPTNYKLWIAVELKNVGEDMFRPAAIEQFGEKVRDGVNVAAMYELMNTLKLGCTSSDRKFLEMTSRSVGAMLKLVTVKNLDNPKLTTLVCVFLRLAIHLKKYNCCPPELEKFVRTSILDKCKLLELSAKLETLNLIEKQPKTTEDHQLLTTFSTDSNPIIKATALSKVQRTSKLPMNSTFQASRLVHQQSKTPPTHHCSGEANLNLTQHISDIIDEMFPDDDDDVDCLEQEERVLRVNRLDHPKEDDSSSAAKRIKLDDESRGLAEAIEGIKRHVEILQRMERTLGPGQRREVRELGERLSRIAGEER